MALSQGDIRGKLFKQGNKETTRSTVCEIIHCQSKQSRGHGVLVYDQSVADSDPVLSRYSIVTSSEVFQDETFAEGKYKVKLSTAKGKEKTFDLKKVTKSVKHVVASGLVLIFIDSSCSEFKHIGSKTCSILSESPLAIADFDQNKQQFCYVAKNRYNVESNGEHGEHVLKAVNDNSNAAQSANAPQGIPNGTVILQVADDNVKAVGIFNVVDEAQMVIMPIWLKSSITAILKGKSVAQKQQPRTKMVPVQMTVKDGTSGRAPPLSIEVSKRSDLPKSKPWSSDELPVDIVLLTVEECEFLACYAYMRNSFKSYHIDLGTVYFGYMGDGEEDPLKVALMKCSEGSSGPGGSQTVAKNAVMQLRPKAIYSVGYCMGLKPEDTNLGDVVISSKLTAEAFQTLVGKGIANIIKYSADGWKPPLKNPDAQEVHVHNDGEILSGIDPVSAKQHHQLHPKAIAVEMEGKGVVVAAHDLKIEWVIVKGISHFVGKTADKSWKPYACAMAASLVSNMLSDPVVFKDWPHYEDMSAKKDQPSTSKPKEKLPCSVAQDAKHTLLSESAWLEECQKQLRSIYAALNKVKIVPWDQSSAVHIDDIYTQLSWLMDNRKPSGVTQEKIEDYTEIFSSRNLHNMPKRILVYGRPGIGKTVFTQKTTFDWSQERFKDHLGTFELVLLLKLRDVHDLEDIPALLRASKLLASDGKISVDSLYDYVRHHQEKVLLILDGYDEYSAGNHSPVREIWESRELRGCCVVVTARQMVADKLRRHSDAQFEINGFDRKCQEEFAQRFLKGKDVVEFFDYLEQQDLLNMTEIPLLLLMLCLLWMEKDRRGLPTSRANIYTQFLQTLFDHMSEKDADSVVLRKVDDYTDELCKLGKLGFEALLHGYHYVSSSELPDHLLFKKMIDVGLFQILSISSFHREKGVYFIHKSIQEYLAAWFLKEELKQLENTTSLSKIDSKEKIIKMFEVFKFATELSEDAARDILRHLGMVAKKEGLTQYNFMDPTPSLKDLSEEQKTFLMRCEDVLFCCSSKMRQDLFPVFLSDMGGVLLINSNQLHSIAKEHLLKGIRSPPHHIFFPVEYSKHPAQDYHDLITVVEDLNAVVVSSSGEKKASEFLSKYPCRPVREFFLKKEENMHLYFATIKGDLFSNLPFPTEMLKELIASPDVDQSSEQDNRMALCLLGDHNSTSCSTPHCVSLVSNIHALYMVRPEVEVLTGVLPLVIAPQKIWITGKANVTHDAQLTETLVSRINITGRLDKLHLTDINLTAKSADTLAKSLYQAPNLRMLALSFNPFLGEGVSVLARHLSHVPRLEILHLDFVMMTEEQMRYLATVVRQSKIFRLGTEYHDEKGNLKPENEWTTEYYWKCWYPDLFPKSESEDEQMSGSSSESEEEKSRSLDHHLSERIL